MLWSFSGGLAIRLSVYPLAALGFGCLVLSPVQQVGAVFKGSAKGHIFNFGPTERV